MYDCPMDTNTPTETTIEISSIGTRTDGSLRVILDPYNAVREFVTVPLADRFGITGEEAEETYALDEIFRSVAEYDSINGREGWRLRGDMTDERYWATVELGQL